ncbi:WD repeat coronin family protein [Cryptosporidium andersoni]|uniref:Coronin n=1 Tax=Cryptosporidium andersoni TaxID=117008 RepID=A0A1J4MDJ9_9CRYT|nr:WD repeat coronin family protein [Cryptosporidium andersoni]
MSRVVRDSKFRNLYGECLQDRYSGLHVITSRHTVDGCGIASSAEFIAFPAECNGNGSVGVIENCAYGHKPNVVYFKGHKAPISDVEFSPFYSCLLVSASQDKTIKLWEIPEHSVYNKLKDPLAIFNGHTKKVSLVKFNPSAEWILASASRDNTIKIWNCETTQDEINIGLPGTPTSIKWSYDGSLLAVSCRDKVTRIIDSRSERIAYQWRSHNGNRKSRCEWMGGTMGSSYWLLTTGFSDKGERQFGVWDIRNLDKSVGVEFVDVEQPSLLPFWDEGTGLFYLGGKGDTNIKVYEYSRNEGSVRRLNEYKSVNSLKGLCLVPKQSVDVMKCEINRILRLESRGVIQPVSFIVPRKTNEFYPDLYPDTYGYEPAMGPEEWISGHTAEPQRISLRPDVIQSHSNMFKRMRSAVKNARVILKKDLAKVEMQLQSAQEELYTVDALKFQLKEKENEIAQLKAKQSIL